MRNDRRDQSGITAVGASVPERPVDGAARAVEEHAEDPQAHPDGQRGRGRDRRGFRQRIAERGHEPDDPEDDEGRGSDGVVTPRQQPETGADEQRDHHDEHLEGELVVRPEEADDEILGAGWLEVDDHLADGSDQRGRTREETGEQLRDAECRRDGQDPGERGRPVASGGRGGRQTPGGRGLGCGAHPTIITRSM